MLIWILVVTLLPLLVVTLSTASPLVDVTHVSQTNARAFGIRCPSHCPPLFFLSSPSQLLDLLPRVCEPLSGVLRGEWEEMTLASMGRHRLREVCKGEYMAVPKDYRVAEMHAHTTAVLRKAVGGDFLSDKPLPIEDTLMYPPRNELPIVFEQSYGDHEVALDSGSGAGGGGGESRAGAAAVRVDDLQLDITGEDSKGDDGETKGAGGAAAGSDVTPGEAEGTHVVVLQHGFQGNVFDLRLFRNYMAFLFPGHKYLIAKANEHDTETDVQIMGRRLAQEVDDKLQQWCGGDVGQLASISFIGHSLGGVIIRTALTCDVLEPYLPKLHTFMSFSSPHLGFLYSEKVHISTGLWLIKRWRKSMALEQLSLTDETDLRRTFMYQLSVDDKLGSFKHVVLVSSHMDKYSPFNSARVELCKVALDDNKNGDVYKEMVSNVMGKMTPEQLTRLNVAFFFPKTTLDTVIGRAAHVKFLDSLEVTMTILLCYKRLFLGT